MQWDGWGGVAGAFESQSSRGPLLLSHQPVGFSCGVRFVDGDAICQVLGRLSPWGVEITLVVFNFV